MAGAWDFVALNQTLPYLYTSSFSERVYMYKKVIAKKTLGLMKYQRLLETNKEKILN